MYNYLKRRRLLNFINRKFGVLDWIFFTGKYTLFPFLFILQQFNIPKQCGVNYGRLILFLFVLRESNLKAGLLSSIRFTYAYS